MKKIDIKKVRSKVFTRHLNTFLLFILICLLGYLLFAPVDVLRGWTITVPDKVYVNKPFTVHSDYQKLMAVTGASNRSVECKDKSNSWVSYYIGEAPADQQPGNDNNKGYPIVINNVVPDLPTTCRYATNVCYSINVFRRFCEFNTSNEFTLYPEKKASKKGSDKKVSKNTTSTPTPSNTRIVQQPTSTPAAPKEQASKQSNTPSPKKSESTEPHPQYKEVCDPLINILGIKVGETNCRQEKV